MKDILLNTLINKYVGKNKEKVHFLLHSDDERFVKKLVSHIGDIRDDRSGIDRAIFREFTNSLKEFEKDEDEAVYNNDYTGVEAHIFTDEFAALYNQSDFSDYLKKTEEIGKNAIIVFVFPEKMSRNMRKLECEIQNLFANIVVIPTGKDVLSEEEKYKEAAV